MNYLAHSILTFSDEHIVGQFLNDFIPNKSRFDYSPGIQQGIILHREIDTCTDAHPEIHEAKKVFQPLVRLYAGAFVDVAFDYFLANSLTDRYLAEHAQKVYAALNLHHHLLPPSLKTMLFHMEKDDWLYHYQIEGNIKFAMRNVLRKAKYLTEDIPVYEAFVAHKSRLQTHFNRFFPDLEAHAKYINSRF